MKHLRIVIVDDHEVVRLGLRTLLDRHPDFTVVDEAATAKEAIAKALQHRPDVVVMDIRLPGGSGIDACREISSSYRKLKSSSSPPLPKTTCSLKRLPPGPPVMS